MALAYSWETFTTIHGDEAGARNVFEKLIRELLQVENPKKEVHRVEAAQGDGGIDCYIQKPEGIDVYQCKYFMGKMTPDRWGQVEKSFKRIMKYSANEGLRVLRNCS